MKKVADSYISLLEAAVKIYDEDYAEPRNKYKLRERVRLIEVRKSLGYESRFTTFSIRTICWKIYCYIITYATGK